MEIKLEKFSKSYKKKLIFQEQNISIFVNDITLLIGEKDTGKTTLCRCISGIDKDYMGNIKIKDQKDVKIAFMPSVDMLIEKMTVKETILFFSEIGNEFKVDYVLDNLGILEIKNKKISKLTYEEKLKVCIACCIINEPNLCILDEPTLGLDDTTTTLMIDLIHNINNKYMTKFLISTNDPRLIQSVNDKVIIQNEQIITNNHFEETNLKDVNIVESNLNENQYFKNSIKRNKKKLLFNGFIMSLFIVVFSMLTLMFLTTSNEFVSGEIRNTSQDAKKNCEVTCVTTPPEAKYFTQEELDYISSYEGIEQITYVYDTAGNIHVTYNATTIATNPYLQAEAYQEETGDMILDNVSDMQFKQLKAPVEYLKNYGRQAVEPEFWDVKYGEIHELAQNEIVIPYSYAKVIAYEQGVEIEELVGKTIIFEDYNTTDMYLGGKGTEFEKEYSTIEYTIAWIYEDVDSAYIYLPYVEDQSLYTTDLDAMIGDLYYFYDGIDEVLENMMSSEYNYAVEEYEKIAQNPNVTEEDLSYVEKNIEINSDLDKKEESLQTGVQSILYTLKPSYSQSDFVEYLKNGPTPIESRGVSSAVNEIVEYTYYERFINVAKLVIILMIILYFLQKLYFKDIYKELQLAKILGFSKKECVKILFKNYIILLIGLLLFVLPVCIITMFVIQSILLPLNACILIIILISIISTFSFILNYYLEFTKLK